MYTLRYVVCVRVLVCIWIFEYSNWSYRRHEPLLALSLACLSNSSIWLCVCVFFHSCSNSLHSKSQLSFALFVYLSSGISREHNSFCLCFFRAHIFSRVALKSRWLTHTHTPKIEILYARQRNVSYIIRLHTVLSTLYPRRAHRCLICMAKHNECGKKTISIEFFLRFFVCFV